jgi:hypothetical protein
MAKQQEEKPAKIVLKREDNACVQTWTWDFTRNKYGPVSVETEWKKWILDEWEDKRENQNDNDDE